MATSSTISQDIAHPIDCFSGFPDFVDAVPWRVFSSSLNSRIKGFEFANGLYPREMKTMHNSPLQLVHVQPSLIRGLAYKGLCLIPSASTLDALLSLYEYNVVCPIAERKRFADEIPPADHYEYTPVAITIDCPIYTRHPITGVVTKHDSPYTNLPRVSTTIHPVFAVHHLSSAMKEVDCPGREGAVGRINRILRSAPVDFLSLYNNAKPSTHHSVSRSPPVTCPELTAGSSSRCSSDPSSSLKKRKREIGAKSSTVIPEWLGGIQTVAFEDLPPDDLLGYTTEASKAVDEALRDEAAWLFVGDGGQRKRQRC